MRFLINFKYYTVLNNIKNAAVENVFFFNHSHFQLKN